jgi:hypothetical protein
MDGAVTKREAIPEIVTRYLAGESLQTIAPDFKVATRTLYRWMLSELGDGTYQDLVTHMLVSRVADADAELQLASDACQIARAREQARFARMDLERRRPHLYGQKQHVLVETVGDLGERLRRALERDVSPIPVSLPTQVIDSTSTRES